MSDTGRPFGPFELFEVVTDSPLGTVYRAQRTADGKEAELFRLERPFAGDTHYLERFLRQAQAAAQVLHPNLVRVIGSGEAGGQYYLAAETTAGGTVGDLLRSVGPLSEPKAVAIARDCARALQAAWDAAQLTHGGIGMEQIRLLPDGTVKLAGLGLARPGESSCVGDMQALGDTLYQMLVNEPPLQPDQSTPDLTGKRSDIGPFISEVIDKMRAQVVWNYAGYDPLLEDLDAVLEQRQPPHAQVKLSIGASSQAAGGAASAVTARAQRRWSTAFNRKSPLVRMAGLLVFAFITWQAWHSFNRPRLLPLPPPPATPPPPIALVPAEPPPPVVFVPPTFASIAEAAERGRAMAKRLGAGPLQAGFGGALAVLDDGQVKWSYAFRSNRELSDFSEGTRCLQGGGLQLSRTQTVFKYPLMDDITLAVEGQVVELDPNAPAWALAVAWHQGAGGGRSFGFTRTAAELCETIAGKRVVLATAPFELKAGATLRYVITQRGKVCVIKVRGGPLLMETFSQPAEGSLLLDSEGCASTFAALEITGTVPAARLSAITP